jgi:hypothetical protein
MQATKTRSLIRQRNGPVNYVARLKEAETDGVIGHLDTC